MAGGPSVDREADADDEDERTAQPLLQSCLQVDPRLERNDDVIRQLSLAPAAGIVNPEETCTCELQTLPRKHD